MPEDVSASGQPDTRPLDRLIRRTRLLLRSTWVLTGLGLTLGLLLGTLTAVTLLDVVAPVGPEIALTPERTLLPHVVLPGSALRLAALLLVLVPAAWVFVLGVLRPFFRRLSATQVARRIESHLPGIHNRLVSTLDLAGSEQKRQQSPAFFRRLLDEALERIRGFRPATVIDHRSLRRAGFFSVAAAGAFVLAFALFAQRLPTALARLFAPFADIPPASGVRYTVLPADAKVLRGEDITFTVRVEHGDPGALRLEMRSPENGQRLRYDLERQKADPRLWTFKLGSGNIAAGFENAFAYRVFGGGTWSKQYQLTMVDRPSIVSLHTVLHYPEYLGLPEPRVNPPQTPDVTGPERSRVEVVVEAEGQVASGTIHLLERLWVDGKMPAGAVAEGTWQWESQGQRAAHTEPVALGPHSHWFRDDPTGFAVQPGETLFADVYIPADKKPEGLMLQWHDGTAWEHRAVWGDDRFREGQANTASRRRMGALPKAGEWVRLQVPAKAVDLEGKTLRGLTFTLFGGRCFWGQAGALPPETRCAMQPSGDNQWTGSFPLERSGAYRVELRNELGHANKDMKEARFTALPDHPPQLVVERPGTDLVLSQPQKVPLVLAAFDDFALADVTLLTQKGFDGSPARQVLKSYGPGQRSDNLVSTLDLPALGMKAGEILRYHVEARDRKGQIARSQDYQVRIAAEPNSADQQMAAFEKSQDPFEQNLAKLLAEQAKVRETVEKMAAKYAPLMEKVQAAQAELREAPQGDPKVADAVKQGTMLNLDPEAAKALEALKKELGELGGKEQQNVQTAQQVAGELARSAEQMSKMPMIPRQVSDQMKAAQQLFQQMAVPSLQDLAGRMTRGAEPRQPPPDLKGMQQLSDRVQKELEALRSRLQALAEARRQLRDNADSALSQLQREIQRQNSGLSARELEELREFLARRQEELKRLEGNQEQLQQETKEAPDKELPAVEKKQAGLDKELEKLLAAAKQLLNSDKTRRMNRRDPTFPTEPYTPEAGEQKVPPKEQDTDEPAKKGDKVDPNNPGKPPTKDEKIDDEEESKFMPALGGPKPKVDPRFEKKQRPVEKRPPSDKTDPNARRDDLQAHQEQNLQDLGQAQQSLSSDQQALEKLLQQLQQALTGPGQGSKGNDAEDAAAAQRLAQMMQSPTMQQAMAMAARMRQGQNGSQGQQQPNPGQGTNANMNGSAAAATLDAELSKLDPATRTVILKMQPRLREELLQGMREEGPEGYRKFIEDYFRRLTEVRGSK